MFPTKEKSMFAYFSVSAFPSPCSFSLPFFSLSLYIIYIHIYIYLYLSLFISVFVPWFSLSLVLLLCSCLVFSCLVYLLFFPWKTSSICYIFKGSFINLFVWGLSVLTCLWNLFFLSLFFSYPKLYFLFNNKVWVFKKRQLKDNI